MTVATAITAITAITTMTTMTTITATRNTVATTITIINTTAARLTSPIMKTIASRTTIMTTPSRLERSRPWIRLRIEDDPNEGEGASIEPGSSCTAPEVAQQETAEGPGRASKATPNERGTSQETGVIPGGNERRGREPEAETCLVGQSALVLHRFAHGVALEVLHPGPDGIQDATREGEDGEVTHVARGQAR
ncbi:hypothetical protein XA68_17482 [Ophiocordyceps unilateralis]|uniref:Uncharacterized protein n=1 Tax=Ophiocordyceps unilateralis TaxID=268505 RepID=A0A2A9P4P9_OPHUN|nr:hypothetical protein XA68_17482 [Ophiocordyceps unilateralis]